VLVYLEAPGVVQRTMELLAQAQTQQDQLYFVLILRNAKEGWTPEERQAYFSWMNLAESKYKGGASFQLFVQKIRQDAAEKLTDEEKVAFKEVLEGKQNVEAVKLETTRQFVHNWQMDDLMPMIEEVGTGRSFESGKAAYEATQCAKCHRFAGDGASTGPDITGVGSRFTPVYLLESFLTPSKVVSDQYRNSIIQTDDGNVLQGRVIDEDDKVVRIRTSPFATALTEIPQSSIEERQFSTVSEMPNGLVNVLTKEEILDLIAYLRSAGNPDDKAFKKP
jgi:putative heme-binding domain-containing protein